LKLMPDVDLGVLTIPVFAAIFSAGWGACVAILVRPMRLRMAAMEAKLDELEKAREVRLALLEAQRMGL
jgi:hypothetical protein